MRIILIGAQGKMGRKMQELLKESEVAFLPIDKEDRHLAENFEADVVVDFSSCTCLQENLALAKKKKIPIVIATTGHSEENLRLIEKTKDEIPVFMSSNFSQMFCLFLKFVSLLETLKDCDFALSETHHKHKKDLPSGSCLEILKKLNSLQIQPQVVSYRVGEIVGIHDLQIFSQNETLQIRHQVFDRKVFCEGVLKACKFVEKKQNGLFHMGDLF